MKENFERHSPRGTAGVQVSVVPVGRFRVPFASPILAIALVLASQSPACSQPSLGAELSALVTRLDHLRNAPTGMTPHEAQSYVDQSAADLSRLGWFDPQGDVPERIKGARLALAIAGSLLHRHGYPDKAAALATEVRIVFATWSTAAAMKKAAALGKQIKRLEAMGRGPIAYPSRERSRDYQEDHKAGGGNGLGGSP